MYTCNDLLFGGQFFESPSLVIQALRLLSLSVCLPPLLFTADGMSRLRFHPKYLISRFRGTLLDYYALVLPLRARRARALTRAIRRARGYT
jgi:hypothetical protein